MEYSANAPDHNRAMLRTHSTSGAFAMARSDAYSRSDQLDQESVAALVSRLEARRRSRPYMQMLDDYLQEIELGSCKDILVLGAGTGVEAREIAQRAFSGRLIALELSKGLVDAGKDFAAQEGIGNKIEWMVGNAEALELASNQFDLVVAHTLLSHVSHPDSVIKEAARVLRRNGKLVIFDGDYATLAYGTSDPAFGESMERKIIEALIANPRIMRMLPRLLREHGFRMKHWRSYAFNEAGRAEFFLASLASYPVLLPKAGVATVGEVEAFVTEQLRASDEGVFFGGYNFLTYVCELEDTAKQGGVDVRPRMA